MAAGSNRKPGLWLANYSRSTSPLSHVGVWKCPLISPFSAPSLLHSWSRFLSPCSWPYGLSYVPSAAEQKAQHSDPLPPLNPFRTGGVRGPEQGPRYRGGGSECEIHLKSSHQWQSKPAVTGIKEPIVLVIFWKKLILSASKAGQTECMRAGVFKMFT